MLNVPAPFPFPGSAALLDGLCFTVFQHNGDGTAILSREGPGASFRRSAPIADLVDPARAAENARVALSDSGEATRRIGLWAARHLQHQNAVALNTLFSDACRAANEGRIPEPTDRAHLARILRQLGWRKDAGRFALYRRVAHERAAA